MNKYQRVTDSEIIKVLELCVNKQNEIECLNCKYCSETTLKGCRYELLKNVLDLINRLKTESKGYRNKAQTQKGELARLYKQNAEQKAEIERLQREIESLNKAYPCTVDRGHNCLVYARSLDDYDNLIADILANAIYELAREIVNDILPKHMYGHEGKAAEIAFAIGGKVMEMTGTSEKGGKPNDRA